MSVCVSVGWQWQMAERRHQSLMGERQAKQSHTQTHIGRAGSVSEWFVSCLCCTNSRTLNTELLSVTEKLCILKCMRECVFERVGGPYRGRL